MCKVIRIKYVSPDGRRRTTERKELCFRSDGTNPCLHQEVSEMTELVSSGTPSLAGDEVPTPASVSMPGTPPMATAHYVYREPNDAREPSSSKGRARKTFGLSLDIGSRKSSSPNSPSRKRRSYHGSSRSASSNGDADSIIAIEEDGHISPISPLRRNRSPLGFPLSMRRVVQPPAIVSQPQPPRLRPSTPAPSHHRRTATAPDAAVRFDDDSLDTELQDRADAREALRRENRERARREDEVRRKQEADDRRIAEELEARERREKAEDDFSMLEYARLQERDRKRRERADAALAEEKSHGPSDEIDELEKEIRQMKIEEEQNRKAREDAERLEQKAEYEKKLRSEDAKIERQLQEELSKIERQREFSSKKQLLQVESELARLEFELAKIQERRQARERAEQLEQEIKHMDVLSEEIRELEEERERDEQLRRIEQRLYNRGYDNQRYSPLPPSYLPRASPYPAPPRPSATRLPPTKETQVLQQRTTSPYEDEDYRRAVGERVLQAEQARAASSSLQRAIGAGPGLGRRNTIGGRDRDREQVYRDLRKRYPQ
ncbi:uncharacterized protein PV09_03308 [Verruconis gallopava]|uniref:Uncharacterized protein n=1 Tax=Verruconis gallopava TaxID=253628 RepID=A0A0D1XTQ6_9PEZI|nr:uncharacterized protein PV09_03308 [Verruconis gallopava]KIW06146.1 hypothetical protein PV09_03308 [Verruconis gallopava]